MNSWMEPSSVRHLFTVSEYAAFRASNLEAFSLCALLISPSPLLAGFDPGGMRVGSGSK